MKLLNIFKRKLFCLNTLTLLLVSVSVFFVYALYNYIQVSGLSSKIAKVAPEQDNEEDVNEQTSEQYVLQGSTPFKIGTGNSKLGIMNLDPQIGSYSVKFYSQNSSGPDDVVTLVNKKINPLGTAYYDIASMSSLGSSWKGSVVVESDKTLFAAVDDTYKGGMYTGGDSYNGDAYEKATPSTEVFLPYAMEKSGDRFSVVTVQGTQDSGTTTVNLSYRDQNGVSVDGKCNNPSTLTINGSRSVEFQPEFDCQGNTPNGSIRLQANNPIVAAFTGDWQLGWRTSYSGIAKSRASNSIYYPNLFRKVSTGDKWTQWSNSFVQNISSQPVKVRIKYFKTGSATPSMQFDYDIPAYSAKEFNTRVGGTGKNPSAAQFASGLGANFNGTSVVEKLTGPENSLIGVAHNFWGTTFSGGSTYTAYSMIDGGSTLYAPFSARKVSGSTWSQWDKVSVMNISGNQVEVEVKYYDTNGNLKLDLTQKIAKKITIPNLSVASINTRVGCDGGICPASSLIGLGNNFEGSVVITGPAGSKLIGMMNILYPNRLNTINAISR